MYPFPALKPCNASVWDLYHWTGASDNRAGMDGLTLGQKPESLEALAHALDVPWDETTVRKIRVIEQAQLKKIYAEREADERRRKQS